MLFPKRATWVTWKRSGLSLVSWPEAVSYRYRELIAGEVYPRPLKRTGRPSTTTQPFSGGRLSRAVKNQRVSSSRSMLLTKKGRVKASSTLPSGMLKRFQQVLPLTMVGSSKCSSSSHKKASLFPSVVNARQFLPSSSQML